MGKINMRENIISHIIHEARIRIKIESNSKIKKRYHFICIYLIFTFTFFSFEFISDKYCVYNEVYAFFHKHSNVVSFIFNFKT